VEGYRTSLLKEANEDSLSIENELNNIFNIIFYENKEKKYNKKKLQEELFAI
jgi:hypothetical protein